MSSRSTFPSGILDYYLFLSCKINGSARMCVSCEVPRGYLFLMLNLIVDAPTSYRDKRYYVSNVITSPWVRPIIIFGDSDDLHLSLNCFNNTIPRYKLLSTFFSLASRPLLPQKFNLDSTFQVWIYLHCNLYKTVRSKRLNESTSRCLIIPEVLPIIIH